MLSQKEAKKNFGFLFIYFYRTAYRSSLNFVRRIENKRGQEKFWLLFNVSLYLYRDLEKENLVLGKLGFLQQSEYHLR